METPYRIEPTRLETVPEVISDLVAELAAATARLDSALNPRTAASLADLVRIMNTYYSNLIEGHDTRPRDIERAMQGELAADHDRRNLQIEALGHIHVQREIDTLAMDDALPEPAATESIKWMHREFYRGATADQLCIRSNGRSFAMAPGEWRSQPDQDVAVGRHVPPAGAQVEEFMAYFETRYKLEPLGKSARILAIPTAHHRFNFIHPFPDGNGRVSRLMSHAMAHHAGIGAHGLWSISRGLARGLESRGEYKRMMDLADSPREGDLDGRGNLSQRALTEFVHWFLRICLDQVLFMSRLFDLDALMQRLRTLVERSETLKTESTRLLEEALLRGEIERGEIPRLTGLPERSARRVFNDVLEAGLLGSATPKGPVSLRIPADSLDVLFPRLFPEV